MIWVTGAAGFIGSALSHKLLEAGHSVVGIDNLNDYYDPGLKKARLERLKNYPRFQFFLRDVSHTREMEGLFSSLQPEKVVHLAAQAGVRYSLKNPGAYIESNVKGFLNILEGCRHQSVGHLIYASTSSVYGLNSQLPLSVHQGTDHPVSLYAATKKANEVMAHSYSHLFRLPTTGVRFFTVYGPWGRPDMALFLFTKNILEGTPIRVFNFGKHKRDFTYIDDLAEGLKRITLGGASEPDSQWNPTNPDPATSSAPYRIFNIGNNRSVELMRYIEVLEDCLGKKAAKQFEGPQQGDVEATWADVSELREQFGYQPSTPVEEGVRKFVEWYREYYRV